MLRSGRCFIDSGQRHGASCAGSDRLASRARKHRDTMFFAGAFIGEFNLSPCSASGNFRTCVATGGVWSSAL
jgi:hypothetical protein